MDFTLHNNEDLKDDKSLETMRGKPARALNYAVHSLRDQSEEGCHVGPVSTDPPQFHLGMLAIRQLNNKTADPYFVSIKITRQLTQLLKVFNQFRTTIPVKCKAAV